MSAHNTASNWRNRRTLSEKTSRYVKYILIGCAAGLLSGLFGIGGGTIIVPALVLWAGMPQRLAAGTSVTAILPTAIVGSVTYGMFGQVEWLAAGCLTLGIIFGAQIGSALLARFSNGVLQWGFVIYLAVTIVSLWFIVPQRERELQLTWLVGILLIFTGLVAGVLSGVMGVGGGLIVVPVMMFFFDANDLSARGTSLVMMVPGSVSVTLGNIIRRNLDIRAALVVGCGACALAPLGVLTAGWVTPLMGNILFSIYLTFICAYMVINILRKRKEDNYPHKRT